VIRELDHPGEVMEEEDPAVTMPRRLGLSGVVERQIQTYRTDVKRGNRLTDPEIIDLFRLVIRRPDASQVFRRTGETLAWRDRVGRWRRRAPRRLAYALARRWTGKRLKRLFGRRVGGFGRGPFSVEGRALIFTQADPGGDACHFLTGFLETGLAQSAHRKVELRHSLCESRGDATCRWEGEILDDPVLEMADPSERPRPGSGRADDEEGSAVVGESPAGPSDGNPTSPDG